MINKEKKQRKDKTPTDGAIKEYRRRGRYTIAYSVAYSAVCKWADSPEDEKRPSREELDLAEIHAHRLRDDYLLKKIELGRLQWDRADTKITPMLPPAQARQDTKTQAPEPYLIIDIDCPDDACDRTGKCHLSNKSSLTIDDSDIDRLIDQININ